jgi:beta-lactamase regulating signal transducer with metallopeptidase domain
MTNVIRELAALSVVERLEWTLIHFVWQALLVSVIVASVLRVFRNFSAPARYVTCCVGLLAVATAPGITFLCLPVFAASSQEASVLLTSHGFPQHDSSRTSDATGRDETEPLSSHSHARVSNSSPGAKERLSPETSTFQATTVPTLRIRIKFLAPWIVAAWILGMVLLSIWHMTGWMLARRLTIHGTGSVTPVTQSLLEGLIRRMGIRVTVRLLESTATAVPILVGWFKPVLLMPASVLSGLPPEQLKAILAHELAHVRRHDFLVNVLQTIVETCLFYHPAVWWMSQQIRIEREYCADEEAAAMCADRDAYARALVSLADSVMSAPGPALAATGGSLTRRIHRILGLTTGSERLMRRPSWLASIVLGLTVIGVLIASSKSTQVAGASDHGVGAETSRDDQTTVAGAIPKEQQRIEITSIETIADKVIPTLNGWKLQEYDKQPSVMVEQFRGYRLVLRRTWKEFTNPPQQAAPRPDDLAGPFELRHEDWEFVLIPVRPAKAPDAIKNQIKWNQSHSPYYTRDVCLGEGWGYVWFTHGTLFGQEFARETLHLVGGDDRIQLWIDGLQVEDFGTNTANSCLYGGGKFGDRALPYIEKTIEKAQKHDDLWRVVGSLGFIQTDRATDLLVRLFDSKNDDIKRAAEYALIHVPYRKAAKHAYFDMLRRQSSLNHACEASVEFQWRDAIPILREVITHPRHLSYLQSAIPARRALEGQPIAHEVLDTERTLYGLMNRDRDPAMEKKIDAARRLLIQSNDSEAVNLVAISLAVMTTKGDQRPVNEAGIEILKSRPRQSTIAFLKALAAGIHKEDRSKVEKLLNAVENAPLSKAQ